MIRIGIVCGCLPTQSGIQKFELYHHHLAEKIKTQFQSETIITSIWYTTLSECVEQTKKIIALDDPDILLFHVRPDPFLRASKLFVRYTDRNNKVRFYFNFNGNDTTIKEPDFADLPARRIRKKHWWSSLMRNSNYSLGLLLGISNKTIRREKILMNDVVDLCREKNKKVILIGPASRPRSKMENYLLKRLEKKVAQTFVNSAIPYVTCFGERGEKGENLFFEDGIHVSAAGHKRISNLIYPYIQKSHVTI